MQTLRKILLMCAAVLVLSFFTFLAFQVLPGDAAVAKLGTNATPEAIEALREELGLNDPVLVRYGRWLAGAVTGDFGDSERYRMPVSELLLQVLPNTILLALLSGIFIVLCSLPLGILFARYPGSVLDRVGAFANQTLMAVPAFFLGILMSIGFGVMLKLFVPGAFVPYNENLGECLAYLVFPAIAVALPKIAMTVRFLRSALLAEKQKDYVRTARSKGLGEWEVMFKHLLPNALPATITFLGVIAAEILAGSVVVEQVFGVGGVGRLLVTSIANRDYNVVQAIVLYVGVAVLVINALIEGKEK